MIIKEDHQFTVTGFTVWGICALFFLYEFLMRTILGTFQTPIMRDLNLSSFQFSFLSTSAYLLIYGLMQIPVGLIADRFGLKKSLFLGACVCALSVIGFAFASNFYIACIFRLFTGFGSSFGFICLLISVYEWMPKRHTALLIGLSQFIGTLGPMIAAGPIDTIADHPSISWRFFFTLLGFFGLFLTMLVVLFVKNSAKKKGSFTILKLPEKVKSNFKQLFRSPAPWWIAFFSSLLYFSIEFLSETDGKLFINSKGHSFHTAAYMLTFSWIGYAVGCPLLGFLSDRFQRRKLFLVIASIFAIISIACIVFVTQQHLLFAAFFFLGIGASGQTVAFATIAENVKSEFLAIALALNNAFITTLAAINAPVIGLVIDSIKETQFPGLKDYQTAFISLVVFAVAALFVVLFFVRETFCKSNVEFTYLEVKNDK